MNNFYISDRESYAYFEEPVVDLFNNKYYQETKDTGVVRKQNNTNHFERINDKVLIANGDCELLMSCLHSNSVDLILTDPPYNLGKFMQRRNTNLAKMRDNHFAFSGWDDLEYEDWIDKMDKFFEHSASLLRVGGSMILFMSIIKVENLIKIAQKHGFYYKTTGIWHKTNPMPRNMNLHFVNSTEAWIYFVYKKATGTFNNQGKLYHDFVETGLTTSSEKKFGKHPTQKPVGLMAHFVQLLSNPNDLILDPFMGSGSSGVASNLLNRSFIGIELNEDYYNLSKNRIVSGK